MDNQHRKITGYRELSQVEIDMMNKCKSEGNRIGELLLERRRQIIDMPQATVEEGVARAEAFRCLNEAERNIQAGFMFLIRSVARPTTFV